MGEITGEMIYPAAIYLMLAGGAIMFIVAFCACIGAVSENKTLLWIFFIVLCCVLFLLLIAAILAIAFSAQVVYEFTPNEKSSVYIKDGFINYLLMQFMI